jgi:hypothetical protein
MGVVLIVGSSVRTVDVYFLELASLLVCATDLEDVCPVVVYSSVGTVRLLGKANVILTNLMLGGLIAHIFLVIYIDFMLSLEEPDSFVSP